MEKINGAKDQGGNAVAEGDTVERDEKRVDCWVDAGGRASGLYIHKCRVGKRQQEKERLWITERRKQRKQRKQENEIQTVSQLRPSPEIPFPTLPRCPCGRKVESKAKHSKAK
jgi:hypothetical protein